MLFLDDNDIIQSPLDKMFDDLGLTGLDDKNYDNYIYKPKQSSEYFAIKNQSSFPNFRANYSVSSSSE